MRSRAVPRRFTTKAISTPKKTMAKFTKCLNKKSPSERKTRTVLRILPDYLKSALHLEREAVCALNNGGVCFVSADFNLVERAEILAAAVMFAVVDSAANVLVCVFGSHNKISLSEVFAVFAAKLF